MLSTPEAQKNPHYWASVFAGHCVIGLILWAILGSVVLVALIYALCWEALQFFLFDAEPWDCILDWIAVVIGAVATSALWHNDAPLLMGCIGAGLIIAAAGALVRLKPNQSKEGS